MWKNIFQNRLFEDNRTIEIETLKRIEMSEAERDGYIRHVNVFHNRLKMYNARSHGEGMDYKALYIKLKKQHEINFKDRLRRIRFIFLRR